MKESLRRVILFAVIVITGSVMILFDVPLIIMIPLVLAVGFVILLLLGAITITDIRSAFSRKKTKKPKKISLIQRLNDMKFFEKKPGAPVKKPSSPAKPVETPQSAPQNAGTKASAGSHLRLFFTSLGSLRAVLKERSKHAKKVEHIDELLDKAVSEKVKNSALTSAGKGADTKIPPPPGSSGQGPMDKGTEQDPFLSLSGDEFDASLLDGLDDQETPVSLSPQVPNPSAPVPGPAPIVSQPEIPIPSLDISSEADDILKDNKGGLEEFSSLEGGESMDQDFSDLDNINLDDIDLDAAVEEETPSGPDSSPSPEEKPAATVNTGWIASDAPKGADLPGDEISTQDDMSSFAKGASGSDADLLSSLASDVKHVSKEKNTSLLRDLKDFKAPATDIENELNLIHETMKAVPNPRKKAIQSPKKTK